MARLTGHVENVEYWERLVLFDKDQTRTWFDQRWQANGHQHFFGGPKNGMLMTTGFWHMRSKYFPREYALSMTRSWALDRDKGFYGDGGFFPLAMSRQAMKTFATNVDHSFGYTPDTAYFTLDGMFRQQLGDPAWRLTLKHLENYNFNSDWKIPVAPEAYRRDGKLFGDQYSNFNAGKLLLYLEGLAGLQYSVPGNRLVVQDTMPTDWQWMEVRLPITMPGEKKFHWPVVRYQRSQSENEVTKSIRVTDCPLQLTIAPWSEEKRVLHADAQPANGRTQTVVSAPHHTGTTFERSQSTGYVELRLDAVSADR